MTAKKEALLLIFQIRKWQFAVEADLVQIPEFGRISSLSIPQKKLFRVNYEKFHKNS